MLVTSLGNANFVNIKDFIDSAMLHLTRGFEVYLLKFPIIYVPHSFSTIPLVLVPIFSYKTNIFWFLQKVFFENFKILSGNNLEFHSQFLYFIASILDNNQKFMNAPVPCICSIMRFLVVSLLRFLLLRSYCLSTLYFLRKFQFYNCLP